MIRIMVDSSADYSLEELNERNIELIPIGITLGENNYRGGLDISADALYEKLIAGEGFPQTAQPSPETYLEHFNEAKENGDSVVCITLSSGLSGTYQSACLAKNISEYDEVYVIDSLSATHAVRVLANHACQLREEGKSASEIADALTALVPRVKVYAGVDTLEFLYKGGRLNKATAVIGELANLKPIISVMEDGSLAVVGKCIGRNKALSFLVNEMKKVEIDPAFPVYSLYAYGTENTEKLEKKLESIDIHCAERCQIGTTIGSHVGPGAFGIVYVKK